MSSEPKQYTHIRFNFNQSSGMLDGSSFDVSAFLLVPDDIMPEFEAWQRAESEGGQRVKAVKMYGALLDKGALLHREDGPAYRAVEKSLFDKNHSRVTEEQYWEKGVRKSNTEPQIKPLGRYTL